MYLTLSWSVGQSVSLPIYLVHLLLVMTLRAYPASLPLCVNSLLVLYPELDYKFHKSTVTMPYNSSASASCHVKTIGTQWKSWKYWNTSLLNKEYFLYKICNSTQLGKANIMLAEFNHNQFLTSRSKKQVGTEKCHRPSLDSHRHFQVVRNTGYTRWRHKQ